MKKSLLFVVIAIALASCSENYSNGERIGVITQFSNTGLVWKSWEGHLNVTQTGMNSSVPFDFSIDNDNPSPTVIHQLDSAAQHGWKVKLVYHETKGKNWFNNRGETDHFVSRVEVLDKNMATLFGNQKQVTGHVIDTIYVVIDKSQLKKK
jgi:hypothetical protein